MLIDYYLCFLCCVLLGTVVNKASDSIINNSDSQNGNVLTVGYEKRLFIKKPITIDMKKFPSLSITGISGTGKTCLITGALMKNKADKVLLNAYEDDFKGIYFKKRITDIEEIERYLDYLLEIDRLDRFTIVVIDEALSLTVYKKINEKIKILLTKNRHKNCAIILLFQELNKTLVPYKTLFTARIAMRMIQQSDYQAALGTTTENGVNLQNREFILLSDNLYYGKSYDIN